MPPTRQEYLDLLKHQESFNGTSETSIDTALGMIKTAAVSFEHLTNDQHWDRFLSYVEAQLAEAKREKQHWLEACGNIGDEGSLRVAQMNYKEACGKVGAFELVMGLPSQLMGAYEQVKK